MDLNTDIQTQHDALIAAVNTISGQLDSLTDPVQIDQAVQQMQQLTIKANQLQGLLFANLTADITTQTKAITDAKANLDAEVKEDNSWASVVTGVSTMLRRSRPDSSGCQAGDGLTVGPRLKFARCNSAAKVGMLKKRRESSGMAGAPSPSRAASPVL